MTFSSPARRAVSVLALTLALGACSGSTEAQQPPAPNAAATSVPQQVPVTSPALVHALPNFAPLVAKAGASVVNVDVVSSGRSASGESQEDDLSEFFRRFGLPGGGGNGGGQRGFQFQPQPPTPQRGSGSGFIVTPDGYIL